MNPQMLASNQTILLVDDELIVRNLSNKILSQEWFCVLEAGDGTEALRIAQQSNHEIGLLLSDIMMPKMDGIELCEKFSCLYPGIPVLLMSGYTTGSVPRNASFLQKPFTPSSLVAGVQASLMALVDG